MAWRDEGAIEQGRNRAGADRPLLSAAGAAAGALFGGILRGGLALYHLAAFTTGIAPAVLAAVAIGIVNGAIGGAMRRAWLGVIVGGMVSLGFYYLLLPVVLFLQFLKVGTVARPVETLVIGAIAGGLGAALGARWERPAQEP